MTFEYCFTYFLITFICAAISVMVLVQININMGSEQEIKAFRNFIIAYLFFDLSNMIWIWINYGYLKIPGTIFSMINLFAICVSSYYWFKFVEIKIEESYVSKPRFYLISLIPLAIAMLLIVSTPFTKWVFYYNDQNQYIHGPLYSTMFVLAISYLLFATIHSISKLKKANSKEELHQFRVLALFMLFPVFAGLLDIVAENLPVMELSLLFGLVLIYTNLQNAQVHNDALTGLNNRRAVDSFLDNQIPLASDESPLYFYLIDADNFKNINDTYGHIEGDKALKIIAEALKSFAEGHRCFVARWGGDEFCTIIYDENLEDPEAICKELQEFLDQKCQALNLPYKLSLSSGYSKCISPYASIDKIIDASDKMLYINKNSK